MKQQVRIDVPLELSSLCVLDATVKIIREAKVASEPEALLLSGRGVPSLSVIYIDDRIMCMLC
jgi:hypothetical protein